jgi:ADP-ribose pyrophosphatase YjhB (NUDIX family)
MSNEPRWLAWARQIQGIAQTGQHYSDNPYDIERYEQLAALAEEILAAHQPNVDAAVLARMVRDERGYATPKVDTRGFVLNAKNEVLLVREKLDRERWSLPGGWADVNSSPSANCAREVLEEGGYRVRAVQLLAFYDRRLHNHPPTQFHIYKAFFRCDLLSPDPVPSPQSDLEISEVGWFAAADLPADAELSLGRVTHAQLRRFFEMARDGETHTLFD